MPFLSTVRTTLKSYLIPWAERMVYHNRQSTPNVYFRDRFQIAMREMDGLFAGQFGQTLPESQLRMELLTDLQGTTPTEAFYILYHLHRCIGLPGDVCEFGVAQGATSALLANELRSNDKNLWLFDSFEGLPAPTEKDVLKDDIFNLGSMQAYRGTMRSGSDEVTGRLQRINFPDSRTKIVAGFIEQTIHQARMPDSVCFAYVDFDFYEPIHTALTYLDRVMMPGGCVIVDDYDWFSTGAKTAVDEFMHQVGARYKMDVPDPVFGHFYVLTRNEQV